ncbi:MAG: TrkH family potassium uptake protein [Desulfovibrionaceae bacterium]|nr:TrkH family potassium uptake protein [Desulfovibrionaceae bacterium]
MREKAYLRQRYASILCSVGLVCLICGAATLSPLLTLLAWPGEAANAMAFVYPAAALCGLGGLLLTLRRHAARDQLSVQEGGVIVCLSWLVVVLFSAWPFIATEGLTFSQAVFESMSGWTTTGLSVVDVEKAARTTLLWRSVIQLLGGAGLAIIMMSAILGPAGVGVSSAEGRGDQLVPNVKRSARLVLIMYAGYAAAGTLAYRIAGMTWFDAVNHAFAAVSTGGFSTRAASIGYWDSPLIEAVTVPLMILGNLSFVTAWFLWRGRMRTVVRNGEVRIFALLVPIAATGVFFLTCVSLYPHLGKAFRVAVFETVSALTTTGFSTVGYGNWNAFGMTVLIGLMLVGGGTCSTAGGIKQFRVHALWRALAFEIRRMAAPTNAVMDNSLWEGERRVFLDDGQVRQTAVFVFLYMALFTLGVLLLCACGFSLENSLFEFASSLGTVGLSIGVTSPDMPGSALWAETLAMFMGRLEFLVVVASLFKLGRDACNFLGGDGSRHGRSA